MIKRYLIVVALILGVLVSLAVAGKPKPGRIKEDVEAAMAGYVQAKLVAPDVVADKLKDVPLPAHFSEVRDYWVAVSYSAKTPDGKTFSCFGAFFVSVCQTPDT
jgi:hypothetical protein